MSCGFFQSGISPSLCSGASKQLSAALAAADPGEGCGQQVSGGIALSTGAVAASAAGAAGTSAAVLLWLPQEFCCCVLCVYLVQAQTLGNHLGAHT